MRESKAKSKAKGTSSGGKQRGAATKARPGRASSIGVREGKAASRLIDQRIRDLGRGGGWRGRTLARMRALILEADPEMTEEWKWMGTPVWSHHGIVCTGEAYTSVVKLTFARGARVPDPSRLFNSSLEGSTRRAIDIREGEAVDAEAFKALVRAAVALNGPPKAGAKAKPGARGPQAVKLLSGGNPQIAKADGDAPVRAYIAAMPGWKCDIGERLDAIIVRAVPGVRKAVKWNSPFYGADGGPAQGWFLSFHVFTRYVKVTFFRGTSLRPIPPGGTARSKDARWIDIREGDELDEARLSTWVKQAAALPGWVP
ncbi:MAG: DUF1801 domain-containing protein [Phycisphaerales bacterium]|nr:DUF1801 domain-containing protein [Phycisphaerales bacterium]